MVVDGSAADPGRAPAIPEKLPWGASDRVDSSVAARRCVMNRPASSLDLAPSSSASRYEMLATIASGGMATVYVGRMRGRGGFSRMVAVKRAHPHLLTDPTYRTMLVDEARLAAKLHHPNVVAVLDVEELEGELSLVMDYVEGASLYDLVEKGRESGRPVPPRIAVRVSLEACAGLHHAHTLVDEAGQPLGLVHRDVSPHNILVGLDGVSRLSDFGIAKHSEGVATTTGVLKGKLSYMAPEYLENSRLDARSDVFSLGVVVWETLAGQKLFRGKNELETFKKVVACVVPPLSSVVPWASPRLDAILFAALARAPERRFQTADEFAMALEAQARQDDLIATPAEVGACVRELFGDALAERRAEVRRRSAPIVIERPPPSGSALKGGDRRSSAPPDEHRDSARFTPAPRSTPPPASRSTPTPADLVPTRVSRAPTPIPEEAVPEASGLQRRAVPPAPMGDPQRGLQPPPSAAEPQAPASVERPPPSVAYADPPVPPRSSGALWKGALVLGILAAAGGAVAFLTTRSGGAPAPSASHVAPSLPAPIATTAAPTLTAAAPTPTPTATSISVGDLPDAKPVPSASSRRLTGRMPGKPPASGPVSYPVTTGIPLSAWPAPPPPPAPEAPAPE
jgi:eukaryotic-like serine/threonine-protein kinase